MRLLLAGIIATVLLATGGEAVRRRLDGGRARTLAGETLRRLATERLIRDQDMLFFRQRVERDTTGALDLIRLGALYLQRSAEFGDEGDLIHAEAAARRALANREQRNEGAWQLLTASLIGQHRFLEARTAAERLAVLDPENAQFRSILGEVLLELGDYPGADSLFGRLTPRRYEAALAPRFARWLELRGRVGEARRLLEVSSDAAARESDATPLSQLAWYELRLAEMALRYGAHAEAARRLDRGLALVPGDWRLLAARARLSLATGDPVTAITLGDSALARHLDPTTLAAVGDAWLARGDSAAADEYYRALEAATQAPRGGFHRGWYLALLDRGRKVPEILAHVRKDLETRQDVFGYDLLAWALFKSGRFAEAREAMAHALAWGTEDPQIHAHATAIGAAR